MKKKTAKKTTKKKALKKRGRPARKKFTAEQLGQIEALAGYGLTHPQIAAVMGMCGKTLYRHKKEQEEIESVLEHGKAIAQGQVGKALFVRAKAGDVAAIRWYEMTRAGRTDRQLIAVEEVPPLEIVKDL